MGDTESAQAALKCLMQETLAKGPGSVRSARRPTEHQAGACNNISITTSHPYISFSQLRADEMPHPLLEEGGWVG